jgi:hypothetical protein
MYYLPSMHPGLQSAQPHVPPPASMRMSGQRDYEPIRRANAVLAEWGLELRAGPTETGWEVRTRRESVDDSLTVERASRGL